MRARDFLRAFALVVSGVTLARAQESTSSASVVLDAPSARVWQAMTTADELAKIWGVAKADIDLRIDGVIRTHGDASGALGDPATRNHSILTYEPERMLALRSAAPSDSSEDFARWSANGWRVIRLEPIGTARVRYTETACGLSASDSLEVRARVEAERKLVVQRLSELFAPPTPPTSIGDVFTRLQPLLGHEFRARADVSENLRVDSRTFWSTLSAGFVLNRSWLAEGDAAEMREQGYVVYGVDPLTARPSFWRFGEGGSVAGGAVTIEENGIAHDWFSTSLQSPPRELYVTIHPTPNGYLYRAQPSRDELTTLLEMKYER